MNALRQYCVLTPIFFLILSACGDEKTDDRDSGRRQASQAGQYSQPASNQYGPAASNPGYVDTAAQFGQTTMFGSGGKAKDSGPPNIERPTDYPELDYRASGTLFHHRGDDPVNSRSKIEMTAENVYYRTLALTSSRSQVQEGLQSSVGTNDFVRPSALDLYYREREAGFRNDGYVIYGRSVTTVANKKLRFSQPIPILIIPARNNRYRSLTLNQPLNYTSTVRGDASYTINTTVTKIEETETRVKIRISYTIPEDDRGLHYEQWPIPKDQIYTIDTQTKRVIAINTTTVYHNKDDGVAKNIVLNHALCGYVFKGDVEMACQ